MPLINCKVVSKLKWTKYCVLFAVGADNSNSNDIFWTIKYTKLKKIRKRQSTIIQTLSQRI